MTVEEIEEALKLGLLGRNKMGIYLRKEGVMCRAYSRELSEDELKELQEIKNDRQR